MTKIVIVGGGGHAKVLISVLKKTKKYEILGYTDDKDNGSILGISYLGDDSVLDNLLARHPSCAAAIGVGMVTLTPRRTHLISKLESLGFQLPKIISPDATVNEDVEISKAVVVFDGVVVNSGTTIGVGSIVNTNSTIEHDCIIGDNVHVCPGVTLSGGVKIDSNSFIGAGANIIQSISICEDCVIGAGATVVKDCSVSGTYIGVPAKRIK